MPAQPFILGLDIGGTKSAVVLGDRTGQIHDRLEFPTRAERGFDPVFQELCDRIGAARSRADDRHQRPAAISVSIGGPLDIARGIIYSPPNLPGWDAVPLKALLADRFRLPVYVEHDGNAGALAEWYFGAAQGARNVVFLTLGTGLGAGLILNGQLYRGTSDTAGEIGHIRVAETGPVAYGKAGAWEAFCSGAGIPRLAAKRFPQRWTEGGITLPELAALATAGDADALAVFKEVGRQLGRGLAILVDTLNPAVIVLGGIAVRLGELLLGPAWEVLRVEALPRALEVCRVTPAALGERLGDVAALCAAITALGGPLPSTAP